MFRCSKDKIDQRREKGCVESITRWDINQQSKGKPCEDREPQKAVSQQPLCTWPSRLSQSTCAVEVPCRTATSPVLMPETMSLRIHSLKRYAGSQEVTGNKRKATLLTLCGEQL